MAENGSFDFDDGGGGDGADDYVHDQDQASVHLDDVCASPRCDRVEYDEDCPHLLQSEPLDVCDANPNYVHVELVALD